MGPDLAGFPFHVGREGGAGIVTGLLGRELRSGKKRGEEVGLTKVGKGTKRMLAVDRNGVPFHLPGQQGRGGASSGGFGTGAGTAGEGASEEEAGKACGGQGIRL